MTDPFPDDLAATNLELKRIVNSLLDGLDQQQADLPGVCDRLARSRSSAWSDDRTVEVTVDAYGIVVGTRLVDNAFQKTNPDRLAGSITEAARRAAATAQRRRAEITAPITDSARLLADLPELVPGAADLREIQDVIGAAARTRSDRDPDRPNSR
ncbi:MAG: YbaB/EbfC family nucleoid-associated protein [Nocardia sp.]|nr:YbaB/EbfC family nucleoid-associated protein [Nocardia sp.]